MRALSLRALLLLAVSASSQPLAWTACRYSPAFPPTTLSLPDWAPPASRADCVPATVPGTVLHALLANGTFPFAAADPYVDTVMDQLLNESDISVLGPAFFTFTFRAALPADAVCGGGGGGPPPPGARVVARVAQLSYRATLYVDGAAAGPPLLAPGGAVGNYRRWAWDLGDAGAWCAAPAAHALALLVLPPDHPGNASAACRGCGQGGNHALAQDIAPQDALGWDWVCGVPDRNTGLLDGVAVEVAPAGALVEDPAVAVADLVAPPGGAAAATSLTATITVALTALGASAIEGTLAVEVPGAGFFASAPVSLAGGARRDVALSRALRNVSLWWPHTHGAPALYDAVATFQRAGGGGGAATLRFRAGFRVVASAVDAALGGRVFSVNGERVFLTGGNFITTDALARPAYRTPQHYSDHVRLHAWAGLNVLRLWGGHGGHGRGLWDAADAQGVLILSEFWQSGDNNGRWAGSYDWPLDHAGYLAAAADTIRAARAHPSLLLHVGGNELYPLNASWAPPLLEALVAALDPRGALFVHSSMGAGPNGTSCNSQGADCAPFDAARVLAPSDGNYGMNDAREYFLRNPGLATLRQLPIAVQPEIGSVAHPTLPSLSRFLSAAAREALPPAGATSSEGLHPAWVSHKWIPMTDGLGVDHAYALMPPGAAVTAADYSFAAQLAQFAQYQALFEGFSDAAWAWYSAVIMWKSAAPWPSFRGALYDFYLAQSGGLFGARAALAAPLHAQLNRQNASLALINRGALAVGGARVWVEAFDVETGAPLPLAPPINASAPALPPRATLHLPITLAPPPSARENATLLWRLTAVGGGLSSATEYLLSTLSPNAAKAPQNFSALARLRWARARVALKVAASCAVAPGGGGGDLTVTVSISLPAGAGAVAVGVLATLHDGEAAVTAATGFVDDRVLPQWPNDGLFAVVPGEARGVRVAARGAHAHSGALRAVVEGWNVEEVSVPVACS